MVITLQFWIEDEYGVTLPFVVLDKNFLTFNERGSEPTWGPFRAMILNIEQSFIEHSGQQTWHIFESAAFADFSVIEMMGSLFHKRPEEFPKLIQRWYLL